MDPMKIFFLVWFYFSFISFGQALTCYKCKFEFNMADCLSNGVQTCGKHSDGCFREERELQRRGGRRVVSAGCGKSWRSANACTDVGGKRRCTRWCFHDLCNGTPGKLNKLGQMNSASTKCFSIMSFITPVFLAYII